MNIKNEDIAGLVVEVPEGHQHIRTTVTLRDGTSITFQEATVSNLVRAFLDVKLHAQRARVELTGVELSDRKKGYAPWQLVEQPKEEQGDEEI